MSGVLPMALNISLCNMFCLLYGRDYLFRFSFTCLGKIPKLHQRFPTLFIRNAANLTLKGGNFFVTGFDEFYSRSRLSCWTLSFLPALTFRQDHFNIFEAGKSPKAAIQDLQQFQFFVLQLLQPGRIFNLHPQHVFFNLQGLGMLTTFPPRPVPATWEK